METKTKTHLLEINLISAQNLKPSTNLRRTLQTYAIAYVDPAFKLRTQTCPGPNPTWNEKFLFRVNDKFLSSETSSVSISIFAVGIFSDQLIGTVRFLLPTTLTKITTPSFSAVQIRRTSGRFHGVLNVAAGISDISMESPAICVRDLSSESVRKSRKGLGSDCGDFSDGYESTASSSSSSGVLKEVNGDLGSDGGGLFCCLGMPKKGLLGPSDRILRALASHMKENGGD